MAFTDRSLTTVSEKANAWLQLGVYDSLLAKRFLDYTNGRDAEDLHHHRECYKNFTYSKRTECAKRKAVAHEDTATETQTEDHSPPKKAAVRSASGVSSLPRKKPRLFPDVCVICSKQRKWTKGFGGCRTRDALVVVSVY